MRPARFHAEKMRLTLSVVVPMRLATSRPRKGSARKIPPLRRVPWRFARSARRCSSRASIVGLARAFGLQTIAEGVEDEATLNLLVKEGVDFAQGFHVGRPAPLPALNAP